MNEAREKKIILGRKLRYDYLLLHQEMLAIVWPGLQARNCKDGVRKVIKRQRSLTASRQFGCACFGYMAPSGYKQKRCHEMIGLDKKLKEREKDATRS